MRKLPTFIGLLLGGSTVGLSSLVATVALADAPDLQAAQARQFGILIGGAASQYDLCVRRGFAPRSNPSAEEMLEAFLKASAEYNHDTEGVARAREGWQLMKQEIAKRTATYDRERCDVVIATWHRILPMVSRTSK